MRRAVVATALIAAWLSAVVLGSAHAGQRVFSATLAGHAVFPAASFIAAPEDAPPGLKTSGKFTTGRRVDVPGRVMGRSAGRPTGIGLPFNGQPVQGFSGIKRLPDGTYLVVSDNGFGTKLNSADHMLMLHRFAIDWGSNTVERRETIFLHDAGKIIQFEIVNNTTEKRYLTGADFDPESIQVVGDKIWLGDEFGPYLLRFDMTGKLEALFETTMAGVRVRSPDHFTFAPTKWPDVLKPFNLARSRGIEGLAQSPDGRRLYALLEGSLWDRDKKAWENDGGVAFLRIGEFDIPTAAWTGRTWKYPLESGGLSIGDFAMIDSTTGLVIERDNGEGTPEHACPAGTKAETCFHNVPKFKRIYKIELSDANAGGFVRKIGYIDLLAIPDPERKSVKRLSNGLLQMPFATIEALDIVDARHIIVGNDNNLPFSSSRDPNRADDSEFVLLEVEAFLSAR